MFMRAWAVMQELRTTLKAAGQGLGEPKLKSFAQEGEILKGTEKSFI